MLKYINLSKSHLDQAQVTKSPRELACKIMQWRGSAQNTLGDELTYEISKMETWYAKFLSGGLIYKMSKMMDYWVKCQDE